MQQCSEWTNEVIGPCAQGLLCRRIRAGRETEYYRLLLTRNEAGAPPARITPASANARAEALAPDHSTGIVVSSARGRRRSWCAADWEVTVTLIQDEAAYWRALRRVLNS